MPAMTRPNPKARAIAEKVLKNTRVVEGKGESKQEASEDEAAQQFQNTIGEQDETSRL